MSAIRILSIDGGGIKGIIPATILVYLEQALKHYSQNDNAHISDYFDLIAGTSTGGLLSVIYLLPASHEHSTPKYSAEDALQLYTENGSRIFAHSFWHKIVTLGGLIGPKYSGLHLEQILNSYCFDTKLSELVKPCLITAYDIYNKRSVFFNSLDPAKPHKSDFFIKDIARATSAAPTYFPPARITSSHGVPFTLVDGGTFANNPTLCAFVEARKLPIYTSDSEFIILSLGTGKTASPYRPQMLSFGGILQWALPLLNIFTAGIAETVDTQMRSLFSTIPHSSHYLRIQPCFTSMGYPDMQMDDASSKTIQLLKEVGLSTTDLYRQQLDQLALLLINQSL